MPTPTKFGHQPFEGVTNHCKRLEVGNVAFLVVVKTEGHQQRWSGVATCQAARTNLLLQSPSSVGLFESIGGLNVGLTCR